MCTYLFWGCARPVRGTMCGDVSIVRTVHPWKVLYVPFRILIGTFLLSTFVRFTENKVFHFPCSDQG